MADSCSMAKLGLKCDLLIPNLVLVPEVSSFVFSHIIKF